MHSKLCDFTNFTDSLYIISNNEVIGKLFGIRLDQVIYVFVLVDGEIRSFAFPPNSAQMR